MWAQAREAAVTVLAGGPADRLVRFRAWPFGWPGAPPQTVAVWVNDVRLEAMTLSEGPRVYSVASPGPAWKNGGNVLRFEFAWAEAPKDRIPGGGDSRTLAAAFDWIEILPAGAEGSAATLAGRREAPAGRAGGPGGSGGRKETRPPESANGPGDSRPPGPRGSFVGRGG